MTGGQGYQSGAREAASPRRTDGRTRGREGDPSPVSSVDSLAERNLAINCFSICYSVDCVRIPLPSNEDPRRGNAAERNTE